MALTWGEIRSTTKSFLGLNTSQTTYDDLMLKVFNEMVQKNLARARNWRCMRSESDFTVYASVPTNNWPTRFKECLCLAVSYSTYYIPLIRLSEYDRWKKSPEYSSEGLPVYYHPQSTQYRFLPTPDEAYTYYIAYTTWATDMADTTDTPDFKNMDDLLIYLLCMHMSMLQGIHSDFTVYRAAIYTEYPPGSGTKSGLMAQAIKQDRQAPDMRWEKKGFTVQGVVRPANYLANPFYMGD